MSVSLVTLVPPVLHRLRSLFMAFLPHLPSSLALLSWLSHKTLLICSFWTCSACSSFCIHSLLSPFPFSLPFSLLTLERYFLMFLTVCLLCFISLRNSWAWEQRFFLWQRTKCCLHKLFAQRRIIDGGRKFLNE